MSSSLIKFVQSLYLAEMHQLNMKNGKICTIRVLGLSLVFVRKATTEFSQIACGAHRQRMAAMRRAGEKRLFCLLSNGLSSALTTL